MGASSRPDARATRLAAAGAVGASVVHELRNALASSLYLARRDHAHEEKLLAHLEKASVEVRHAQAVVAAVLGLARGDALLREATSMASLIATARGAVVLPTNVTFSTAISPQDLQVACDPVLLERVLSNLYLNAIEALAGRGRGAITTRVARVGDVVELIVEDDGPGIDVAHVSSIFDPLFSTKDAGTGLGLALVRAVAEAHGGSVEARARGDAPGAQFIVRIPA
jgi:signal transduction histidine kinase